MRRRPVSHFTEPLESRLLFAWIGALSGTTNDASRQYDNTANWAGGVIDDSFAGVTFTGNTTLYLAGNRTTGASGLNLNYLGNFNLTITSNSATTRTLTLAGDISGNFAGSVVTLGSASNPVNIALGTSVRTANLAAGKTLVIPNVISGTGGITKSGAGTLTLSGVNTYSGVTTVSAGQLNLNNARAIGTGTLTLNGGSLDNTSGASITLTSNNVQSWASDFTFVGSNALNLGTGAVTLTANRTLTTTASTLTVGGVVAGAFSLTKAGAGALTLSGANTYSGGFTLTAGQFNLNNARAPGTGTITINGGSVNNTSGAAITLTNNNAQSWAADFTFVGSNALNLGTGAVTLTGDRTVTVSASTFTVGGVISGAFRLTKAGTGTLTLSGANTYSGGFTLSAGQFNLNNARAPGTGTITINGGTLDNTSGAAITLTNNNAQSWAANFTFVGTNALNFGTGAIALTANRTVTVSASTLTAGGVVSGAFRLTKAGAGTLSLSGANTYSGGTTLNAGTLTFLNGSLGSTGTITFAASSTLQWGGTNTQDISSRLTAVPTGVTATFDTVANSVIFAAAISGAGLIAKSGSGILTLSGNNSHTGGTTLSAGTLNINSATALGTGTFTISGGTINNTSGAAVTISTNNAQSWGGNFTFTGTNSLNLGTGNVTLTGNRTVTANASTLVIGGVISGAFLLSKAGNGALTLTGNNTHSGGTTLSAGTLNINSASALGTGTFTLSGGSIDNTSGSALTLTTNNAVSIGANFTFTGTGNLNLGTGTVALTGNRTITANANTLTFGGNVSGAFSLTKAGNGALTLSGNNTYSGGTTVSAGTLNINSASAIGTGTLTLSGGTIDNSSGSAVTLSTNNVQSWSSNFTFGGTNSLNLGTGAVTLTSARTVTTNAGTLTVGGAISGAFSLNKAGNGAITLAGNNTYSGGTTLSAGTLNINSATAIGTGTLTLNGGTLDNTSGSAITLTSNNAQSWAGNLSFTGQNDLNLGTGAVSLTANRTVTVDTGTLTVAGVISGARSLTKAGNGSLTLSGNNTYSLGTTLTAGTLNLNSPTANGTGTLTLSGGTLGNTSGSAITLTSNNAQSWGGNFAFSGPSPLNLGTGAVTMTANRTLTTSAGSLTVAGVISGAFSLQKSGVGTLTLAGNNTYSGGTTLSDGMLNINTPTAIGTGLLTLSSGTIDNTSGSSITLSNNNAQSWAGNFTFAGTRNLNLGTGAVTLTADTTVNSSSGTLTIGGAVSGAFALSKTGSGALTLSGNNTFSGGTTLSAGTLNVNSATAISTGTLTLSGGTLDNTSGSTITLANNNAQTWSGSFVFAGTGDLNLGSGAVSLTANDTVTVASGHLVVSGVISGAFGLTKLGSGTLELAGASTFSGGVTVTGGLLLANNSVLSTSATGSGPVSVASGATLGGTGSAAGPVSISSGGRLSPGIGSTSVFNVGALVLDPGANLDITLNGDTAGSGFDQVVVAGSTTVDGAILNLSGSRSAQNSATLAIILNTSVDAITGTFAGLAEGDATPFNGVSYVASYSGSSGNDLVLTAQPAVTTTALSTSASSVVFGQAITFIATITSSTAGTRTGTVTFLNDVTPIGTASVDASGIASLTLSTLSAGVQSITAIYGGDLNFASSTSSALTQTVNQASTTTSVTSSASPAVTGQSITFTATVTPSVTGTVPPTGTVSFFDGASMLGSDTIDASGNASFTVAGLGVGSHSITVVFSGDNNFSGSTSALLSQTVNAASTTTSVSSSTPSPVFGQPVTFTATVITTSPGSGVPAGTVTFFTGATSLGTGTLDLSGMASLSTSTLAVGSHSITAVFEGSTDYNTSTSPALTQVVTAASTTTTVSSSVSAAVFGQQVSLSASVTTTAPGSGVPTGTVTFFDGATPLGTVSLDSSGTATFSTSTLSVGSHSITAVFAGNDSYTASISSELVQAVNAARTSTSVISSNASPVFGQAVTLSATVIAISPGSGVPTGSVSFFDGATALGTGTLDTSGVASLSTSTLAVGSRSITAVFSGTSDHETSTSTALTQTVNQAQTITSVVSIDASPVFGQPASFTATVVAQSPGSGTPTGVVSFFDGDLLLGSASLNSSGEASFSSSTLPVGTRTITAVFAGDTNFTASTSPALSQSVSPANTTTSLSSSVSTPVFGQTVTLTATVLPQAPGAGVPTGTVSFFDGSTPLGTASLDSAGIASLTISSLAVGDHNLTANYSSSINFTASTSAGLPLSVNPALTSTSLTSATTAIVFGQAITLSATVVTAAPGSGVPAGVVTFFSGNVALGSATLDSSGTATFVASSLSAGNPTITAVFNGNNNFALSTSSAIIATVARASSIATLISSSTQAVVTTPVTLTTTLRGTPSMSALPTGVVTLWDGSQVLATSTLDSSGNATFTLANPTAGARSFSVTYSGDDNFSPSTSTSIAIAINRATTTTTLTTSTPTSTPSQSVLLTAVLESPTITAGTPTGTVSFMSGAVILGTAVLDSSATATLSLSTLPVGNYTITAVYSGDAIFVPSTSLTQSLAVERSATSTSISASSMAPVAGSAVTFTAAVTSQLSTPTGTVTFMDGTMILGIVQLNPAGVAVFTTSNLSSGTHSITAIYSGDATFVASTSAPLPLTVAPAANPNTNTPPVVTFVTTPSQLITTASTAALSVSAIDDGGESNLTFFWETTLSPIGSPVNFSNNSTNSASSTLTTFNQAGTYTFTLTTTDAGGLSTQSSITITVLQSPTVLLITPSPSELRQFQSLRFSTTALDQFGDTFDTQPTTTWSILTGPGSIDSDGTFVASNAVGPVTLQATTGTTTASVQFNVTPFIFAPVPLVDASTSFFDPLSEDGPATATADNDADADATDSPPTSEQIPADAFIPASVSWPLDNSQARTAPPVVQVATSAIEELPAPIDLTAVLSKVQSTSSQAPEQAPTEEPAPEPAPDQTPSPETTPVPRPNPAPTTRTSLAIPDTDTPPTESASTDTDETDHIALVDPTFPATEAAQVLVSPAPAATPQSAVEPSPAGDAPPVPDAPLTTPTNPVTRYAGTLVATLCSFLLVNKPGPRRPRSALGNAVRARPTRPPN